MFNTEYSVGGLRKAFTEMWKEPPNIKRVDSSGINFSDKSKIMLTMVDEHSKLMLEAMEIEAKQREVHTAFVMEMKRLSKHHEAVLTKMITIEEFLN